jgi:hypothetical protein
LKLFTSVAIDGDNTCVLVLINHKFYDPT